jgi:hypothetical protein
MPSSETRHVLRTCMYACEPKHESHSPIIMGMRVCGQDAENAGSYLFLFVRNAMMDMQPESTGNQPDPDTVHETQRPASCASQIPKRALTIPI